MNKNLKIKNKLELEAKNLRTLCASIVGILIFMSVLIFVWIKLMSEDIDNVAFNVEKARVMTGEWQAFCNDEQISSITLPSSVDANAGDKVKITRTLEAGDIEGNSLMFYVRQAWVEVTIGDEVILKSDEDRKTPFEMVPGSYWHFCRIPEEYAGKRLTIELKPAMNKYAGEIPTVYMGTKAALIYMVLEQGTVSISLLLPILVMGIILIIGGVCSSYKGLKRRLFRLGLFAVISSMWLLLESRITQVLVGDMVLASYVLFACYYILPMIACSFLLTYESLEKRKSVKIMFMVSAVSFVAVQVLQIANILSYMDMLVAVHILLILIIADTIRIYIDIKKKRIPIAENSVYIAMMLLGICCVAEVLSYYMFPQLKVGNFSKVGLLLFFGYLAYSAIRQYSRLEIKEAENRVYQKLAYTDMMTGLANRTAFEKELEDYRKAPWAEETIILVGDMNRLKFINDNYGHAAGDRALIQIAKLMESKFKDKCKCYRTGGDEFCVISRGISEDKFDKLCKEFEQSVKDSPQEADWEMSVSCGYAVVGADGIDECYKKADAIMYAAKVASKQQRIS